MIDIRDSHEMSSLFLWKIIKEMSNLFFFFFLNEWNKKKKMFAAFVIGPLSANREMQKVFINGLNKILKYKDFVLMNK